MIAGPFGYCDVVILRQFIDSREAIQCPSSSVSPFRARSTILGVSSTSVLLLKIMDSTSSRSPTTTTRGSMIRGTRRSCGRSSALSPSAPTSVDVGVGVTCPTTRIHPAVLAQSTATCASLLEGRFTWGVGTGEALNEHILGDRWPPADLRFEQLEEAIEIVRRLWTGEQVTYRGRHYCVENARIYDPPVDTRARRRFRVRASKPPNSPGASATGCGPAATPL